MEAPPGWNDPPESTSNPKEGMSKATRLNRRIGFPTSEGSADAAMISTAKSVGLSDAGAKPFLKGTAVVPSLLEFITVLIEYLLNLGDLPPPPPKTNDAVSESIASPENISHAAVQVMLQDVMEMLERSLAKSESENKIDASKSNAIRKRLKQLEDKWNKEQLNDNIKSGMFELSKCLEEGTFTEAETIQQRLNTTFPQHCTPWIIAVRQMILAQKE